MVAADGVTWEAPIHQSYQVLKVPVPTDVQALIERKHTTITALRDQRPTTAPARRPPPARAKPSWDPKVSVPNDVRALMERKHTTVTAPAHSAWGTQRDPGHRPQSARPASTTFEGFCRGRGWRQTTKWSVVTDAPTADAARERRRLDRATSRPRTAPVRRRNGAVDHVRTAAHAPLFDISPVKRPRKHPGLTAEERRVMLANGWPGSRTMIKQASRWGGDHASRVLPFAAGFGQASYADDASFDDATPMVLESAQYAASRQMRLSDLLEALGPPVDDSLAARQGRLFRRSVGEDTVVSRTRVLAGPEIPKPLAKFHPVRPRAVVGGRRGERRGGSLQDLGRAQLAVYHVRGEQPSHEAPDRAVVAQRRRLTQSF